MSCQGCQETEDALHVGSHLRDEAAHQTVCSAFSLYLTFLYIKASLSWWACCRVLIGWSGDVMTWIHSSLSNAKRRLPPLKRPSDHLNVPCVFSRISNKQILMSCMCFLMCPSEDRGALWAVTGADQGAETRTDNIYMEDHFCQTKTKRCQTWWKKNIPIVSHDYQMISQLF